MHVEIRLFAGLAEVIGSSRLSYHIAEPPVTAGRLKELLSASYPDAASQIAVSMTAVDHEYAGEDTVIAEGSEVALIPPVSGGEPLAASSADGLYAITELPLEPQNVLEKVQDRNRGASLLFLGTVREMTGEERTVLLEYEAYVPMALAKLEAIGRETEARWDARCAIVHRIGPVGPGEASVAIAVASAHRDAAYEASRYAIEELKRSVPIWKKDVGETGQRWKGGEEGTKTVSSSSIL